MHMFTYASITSYITGLGCICHGLALSIARDPDILTVHLKRFNPLTFAKDDKQGGKDCEVLIRVCAWIASVARFVPKYGWRVATPAPPFLRLVVTTWY